ncbi:FecR domain-containing protein [Chitinophaga tropicalis]|uniref:DUF4974 domain-containing protein n=1 Tax=Chitinophaga tropicalis TaxID=2683588 RepID=A0A7K1U0F2_9BACT|nr:FecR domain-containing protein [Chitinophaga tropicalis]MVT07455.1 DUF4974 domain-containing protein [Chitinophaga tropicalis]
MPEERINMYKDYTVTDFLHDALFRKWVIDPDAETENFWKSWLEQHPERREIPERAREVLLIIGFDEYTPAREEQEEVWSRIKYTIQQPGKRIAAMNVWRYAAIFSGLLLMAVAGIFIYGRQQVQYATVYGEVKTIILPDKSVVRLNANSVLRHRRYWLWESRREIWISGEGFFTVVHKQNHQPFFVHTTDVDVKVTGTEFDVNTRRTKTQVVLSNGAVQLDLRNDGHPLITMKPGQMVTYSAATNKLDRKDVNPSDYSAWRNNMLVFTETPIAEVAASLEDNLGLNIHIEDTTLQQELFTGSIPMDDAEIFFKTLYRSFHVRIEKENKNYSIRRK